jgi:outer membrane protein assembly factor BamB
MGDGRTDGRARLCGRRRVTTLAAIGLALALALGACGGGAHRHARPATTQAAMAIPPAPQEGGSSAGWLAPNGDLANTRWISGPIDAATVGRLAPVWKLPANTVATPVVADGIVYTQDTSATVYAVDLASGRLHWKATFSEAEGSTASGPNGVTLGDGHVYGATETTAFALDARTGRRVWLHPLVTSNVQGIDMAPAYANGTLYVSTVPTRAGGADYGAGARGVMWALDGATGRPRWSWDNVEAGLWGDPRQNAGGGVWHTPAIEPDGIYLGIGNPGPAPGSRGHPWGSSRPGPNRWTDSLVKLDPRTGRFLWGRQVLAHDLYDWDLECPPILARAGKRPIVVAGGKMGFVYAFDRASGKLLWKRSVGLHNGHDADGPRSQYGTDRSRAPRKVLPGVLGGVVSQMAADRDTVYVPVNNLFSVFGPESIVTTQGFGDGKGELVALDLATGRVRWDRRLPSSVYSAATVSNDLVFTATYRGVVYALRTDTGAVAWTASLPDGSNGPLGVAGDTLFAPSDIPFSNEQAIEVVAYRLRG